MRYGKMRRISGLTQAIYVRTVRKAYLVQRH